MNKKYSISKLYPPSCYREKIREQGSFDCIHKRCSGATTGRALGIISDAMQNPSKTVPFGDGTAQRTLVLANTVGDLIVTLELQHLVLNKSKSTLTYNIYNSVIVTEENRIYVEID